MDDRAPAGALTPPTPWRADPPPWSENGLWLLWGVLSCGMLVAVGFFLIGARYRRRAWQWSGAFYAAVGVALFVTIATIPRDADGEMVDGGWQDVAGSILLCVLLAGVLHAVVVQLVQPRRPPPALPQPGAVSGPWLAASVGYHARRTLWPSRYADVPPPARATYARQPVPGPYPPAMPVAGPVPPAVEPWASFVRSAERSRDRFHAAAARVPAGPLRGTVDELAGRIDASVGECRRVATGGQVLAQARSGIDTAALDLALSAATARQAADPDDARDAGTVAALRSQRATADRLDRVIEDTLDQLRLLDARFGDAVARMLELSAQAEVAAAVPELSGNIDGLLTDLEALRLAVEETQALDVVRQPPGPGALAP